MHAFEKEGRTLNEQAESSRARELEVAVRAVREAAVLTRAVQDEIAPGVLEKKDRSPVTVADFGSQALVCRAVSDAFGDDPIVGEEDSRSLREPGNRELAEKLTGEVRRLRRGAEPEEILSWIDRGGARKTSERFWTLDPIDGTKGFLRKEQYAISLALLVDGRLSVAALACPRLPWKLDGGGPEGVVMSAARGQGAFVEPLEGGDRVRLKVSDVGDPRRIRFCESVEKAHSSHGDAARIAERLEIEADPVRIDSQAKYAVVARGQGEAYLRLPKSAEYREKIWDHAGGALVVEEAGGRVSDIRGRPLDFSLGATLDGNRGVIVTNGAVHDAVLEAIEALEIGAF